MSLLRFIVVSLLKVILLSQVSIPFRVALKVSIFKSLVDLSSKFHTTEPLYEKLFLPYSVWSCILPFYLE